MKKILFALVIIVALASGYYFLSPYFVEPTSSHSPVTDEKMFTESNVLPKFTEIPLTFDHLYKKDSYPFTGSTPIDIDQDGVDEIFIGGGEGQDDALFKYKDNKFVNIIANTGLSSKISTGGAITLDTDNDGDQDLYVARFDDIYLYINNNGTFKEVKLNITFEKDAIPLSLSASDINKDGLPDLYISTFKSPKIFKLTTFNNNTNRSNNIMLLNKGNNNFEDITKQSGLSYNQNTYLATFVDLNNDTWQDLVISPNTDQAIVYKNLGNGTFEKMKPLTDFGFWMGLAIADIDNDGDQDLFFSNVGKTIKESSLRGDLRSNQILNADWAMMRNDGNFNFTDITKEKKLNGFEFAWGALFGDLNLNGFIDLIVVENYIKWPAHKLNKLEGRVFLQNENRTFSVITEQANLRNPYYGTSPLLTDFNGDGYPELLYINLAGPSRAFLNDGGTANYIKVIIPKSAYSLGAKVKVERTDGKILYQEVISGMGLMSDVSSALIFGLDSSEVKDIQISWTSGEKSLFNDVKTNTDLLVKVPVK